MLGYGLAITYGVVAAACVLATVIEGRRNRERFGLMHLAGLLLCLAWPLLVLFLLLLSLFGEPGRRRVRYIVQGSVERRLPAEE